MPNIDGGHYFLTALFPVRTDLQHLASGLKRSHVHGLREVLAKLPTAQQSPETEASGRISPFARSRRTHFARLFVIDDVAYNGRLGQDPIVGSLENVVLTKAQPVDRLNCPYLVFVVDFDKDATADPASYLKELWAVMGEELREVFRHCLGFETHTADAFADYVQRGQIETTFPFNDYFIQPPALPTLSLTGAVLTGLAAMFVAVVLCQLVLHNWLLAGVWGLILGGVFGAWNAIREIMVAGAKPFPVAPNSDLPSVLKALAVRQQFSAFVAKHQTDDPAALYQAFGAFLAESLPDVLDQATQSPGVVAYSGYGK